MGGFPAFPLVAPGLRFTGGDELGARLLEGEDSSADGAQAAEADQGELKTRLGGRLFEFGKCVHVRDGGSCASLGPAPDGLMTSPMLRLSRKEYTIGLGAEVVEHNFPGVLSLHPVRPDMSGGVDPNMSGRLLYIRSTEKARVYVSSGPCFL